MIEPARLTFCPTLAGRGAISSDSSGRWCIGITGCKWNEDSIGDILLQRTIGHSAR